MVCGNEGAQLLGHGDIFRRIRVIFKHFRWSAGSMAAAEVWHLTLDFYIVLVLVRTAVSNETNL